MTKDEHIAAIESALGALVSKITAVRTGYSGSGIAEITFKPFKARSPSEIPSRYEEQLRALAEEPDVAAMREVVRRLLIGRHKPWVWLTEKGHARA